MKIKSSPLTEAILNAVITLALAFIALAVAQDITSALNQISTLAVLYLLPAFVMQWLIGIPLRSRPRAVRFTVSLAIALVISAFVCLIVVQGLAAALNTDPSLLLAQQQAWIFISVTYFVSQLFAALVTHFLITKQK